MEDIVLVSKIIDTALSLIPTLLTGLITFLITKYAKNKSVSLDKIEVAYNRIYYPLYKMIRNKMPKEIDQKELQNKMEFILLKYDKYISQSTRNTYVDYLQKYEHGKKSANRYLAVFCDNVFLYNANYRSVLGYPQANTLELYYTNKEMKRVINCTICLAVIYILALIYQYIKSKYVVYATVILMLYLIFCILGIAIRFVIDSVEGIVNKKKK